MGCLFNTYQKKKKAVFHSVYPGTLLETLMNYFHINISRSASFPVPLSIILPKTDLTITSYFYAIKSYALADKKKLCE